MYIVQVPSMKRKTQHKYAGSKHFEMFFSARLALKSTESLYCFFFAYCVNAKIRFVLFQCMSMVANRKDESMLCYVTGKAFGWLRKQSLRPEEQKSTFTSSYQCSHECLFFRHQNVFLLFDFSPWNFNMPPKHNRAWPNIFALHKCIREEIINQKLPIIFSR